MSDFPYYLFDPVGPLTTPNRNGDSLSKECVVKVAEQLRELSKNFKVVVTHAPPPLSLDDRIAFGGRPFLRAHDLSLLSHISFEGMLPPAEIVAGLLPATFEPTGMPGMFTIVKARSKEVTDG